MNERYASLVPFILVLCHFAFDWVYQSHAEAMAKSTDHWVRYVHCVKYAVPFAPVLWWFGMDVASVALSLAILFSTHYVIDSYVPVMLWAKYLRRAPQFANVGKAFSLHAWQGAPSDERYADDIDAFKAMAATPLGLILVIVMDQFLHIACLLPVAFLALK